MSALTVTASSQSLLYDQQHTGMSQSPIGNSNTCMPVVIERDCATIMREEQGAKPDIMARQQELFKSATS